MIDPIAVWKNLAQRRRKYFIDEVLGSAAAMPRPEFLAALHAELGLGAAQPVHFSFDVELDTLYAAFSAAAADGEVDALPPIDDRRGILEMDGFRFDAALAYRDEPTGPVDLVLLVGRSRVRWDGRRIRKVMSRLRHVFGDDGTAVPGAYPHLVLLSPERPTIQVSSRWPAWTTRPDGSAYWLKMGPAEPELRVVRCDKRGKKRPIGDYWRITKDR